MLFNNDSVISILNETIIGPSPPKSVLHADCGAVDCAGASGFSEGLFVLLVYYVVKGYLCGDTVVFECMGKNTILLFITKTTWCT